MVSSVSVRMSHPRSAHVAEMRTCHALNVQLLVARCVRLTTICVGFAGCMVCQFSGYCRRLHQETHAASTGDLHRASQRCDLHANVAARVDLLTCDLTTISLS